MSDLSLESRRQLETLVAGVLLLWGWLMFAGMAFSMTLHLLIPTSVGFSLLSRARSIRERRILTVIAISLAVFSAILWAYLLWVGPVKHVEVIVDG